jgi:hypothetical protein
LESGWSKSKPHFKSFIKILYFLILFSSYSVGINLDKFQLRNFKTQILQFASFYLKYTKILKHASGIEHHITWYKYIVLRNQLFYNTNVFLCFYDLGMLFSFFFFKKWLWISTWTFDIVRQFFSWGFISFFCLGMLLTFPLFLFFLGTALDFDLDFNIARWVGGLIFFVGVHFFFFVWERYSHSLFFFLEMALDFDLDFKSLTLQGK